MLDPLFPVSIECLKRADAETVVSGGEYLVAFLVAGRLVYKLPALRGVLDTGQLFLAGAGPAVTLSLQRDTDLRLVRFSRAFYDRLDVLLSEPDFLAPFFPPPGPSAAPKPVIVPARGVPEGARALFDGLAREWREKPAHYRLLIQSRLIELFVLLDRSRGRKEGPPAEPERSGSLNAVIRHIQEHYTDEFSLDELAERAGLASAYFSRLFHEKTGRPLFEFINSIRIQKACQLLKRTNLSIIEIAYAVGYNNLSFFNRYFRRLMRVSPREYKNL